MGGNKQILSVNTCPCTAEDSTTTTNSKEDIATADDAIVSHNNGVKIPEVLAEGTDTTNSNEGNASGKEESAQTAGDTLLRAITSQGMVLILDGN